MNPLAKIQRVLYQSGGYQCPHFQIQKLPANKSWKTCCGDKGEQYAPVCKLINGLCVGLPQCPRLDIKTKSELIKQWSQDLQKNTVINPLDYIKK